VTHWRLDDLLVDMILNLISLECYGTAYLKDTIS